jgi:hypothetical protein
MRPLRQHHVTAPAVCANAPTVAGLRFSEQDRTVWLGFACDVHAGQLMAPRLLLPRDRDVLRIRQTRERTELDGRRWAGLREGPLVRGSAAKSMVTRARAWEALHP